jgi:hypothetical protein
VPTPTHQPRTPRRPRIAAAVSLLALASVATLSACGGSSHPKTATSVNTAQANAVTATATGTAPGAQTGGQANGNTSQNGTTNPTQNGTTSPTQNGSTGSNGQTGSTQGNNRYPVAFVAALHTFTNCVRAHGLNIPEPNLTGHGEIFNKNSVNPSNPNYRTALQACQADLIAILRAAGGSRIKGLGG